MITDSPDLAAGVIPPIDVFFDGDTVNSIYFVGSLEEATVETFITTIDLTSGDVNSESGELDTDTLTFVTEIHIGPCAENSGEVVWEVDGSGYDDAGAGVIVPWGYEGTSTGADTAIPVWYGEGTLLDASFDQLLNRGTYSVAVVNSASDEIVACGDIGGVVDEGRRFWEPARLAFGIGEVGDSGWRGCVMLIEDTGILHDRVHLSVFMTNHAE